MGISDAAVSETAAAAELKSKESKLFAIMVLLAASVIQLFTTIDMCVHNNSTSQNCRSSRNQLPIWLGCITLILCIIRLLLFRYSPAAKAYDMHLSFIFTVCWSFGVAFNTSTGGPFTLTNNGYYSTWIALLSSLNFACLSIHGNVLKQLEVEISRQNQSLLIVFLASFIEMAVAADVCNTSKCNAYEAGATAVGLISVCLVGTHLTLVKMHHPFQFFFGKILAPLLVIGWSLGAAFNTSNAGPFTSSCNKDVPAANGYFSTWIAFFGSLRYVHAEFLTIMPNLATLEGTSNVTLNHINHDQPYQPILADDDEEM